jgi:cation diffusion facilitator family transporter
MGAFSNLLLFILKFSMGITGASQALVADAFHSLSDIGSDFAIIFGVKYWNKPADTDHPYGHKRIETMISAAIGFALFFIGILIAYKAASTIITGKPIPRPGKIALSAALISIVIKEIIYRKTVSAGKRIRSSALIANAWHHRSDAISSIPVAIAIAAASFGGAGFMIIDRIGALAVSFFILKAAFNIIKPAINELCESGLPEELREQLFLIAINVNNVKNVHAIRYRKMSSEIFVDMHILVNGDISVYKGHEIATKVKNEIIEKMPEVVDVTVHVEPYKE